MIEEFTDVNRGEKLLMKMWNVHVLEQRFVYSWVFLFFQDAIQIKSADTLLVCDVGGYGISLFKNKLSIKPLTVSFFVLSSYVADFMVAGGCETFVEKYGKVIIKEGLIRNFLIHLNNLLEFQVISQTHIVAAMDKLTKLKAGLNEE